MTDPECGRALLMEDVFQAVSNSGRRRVILSVNRGEDGVDENELSVEISSQENAVNPSKGTGEQSSCVDIASVRNHLNTLDELGTAYYDPRSKLIESTDATVSLARVIREVTSDVRRWSIEFEIKGRWPPYCRTRTDLGLSPTRKSHSQT